MKHYGDFDTSAVIYGKFTTYRPSTGAPYTLAGTPALSVYKDNSTTQSTTGVTLTADFDSVTGLNHFAIDTSADGTFYSTGSFFEIVITTGTVDSVSAVGTVVGAFTIRKNSALKPATAGRTLVVDAAGLADANVVKAGPSGSGVAWNANTTTHLNQIYDTDYATVYDATNKAFLSKLGNFAMGGSSLALTTGAIACTTITASGAVAFQSTFGVTGTVTYNAFTCTNAFTVSGATVHTGNVSMAAGLTITQSTTNGHGITVTGNGTGSGFLATAGATGIGFSVVGGSTSGDGIKVTTTSGHGMNLAPVGSNAHGLFATGGNGGTSDGIKAVAGTGGVPIRGNITGNITGTIDTCTTVTNQLTGAQIATAIFQDTTAGDFTAANSIGKSIMNGVSLGTGLTVARCTLTDTVTTYTGNTPQTGDSFALIGTAGVGLTNLGDTRIAHLDADITSRAAAALFSGITSVAQWLGLIAGKQTGNSTARTEIRATGAGSGTFDETTDSQEALRDRGDSAWITATSVTVSDKTGFKLASDGLALVTAWTVDITGSLSGSVGSVTGNVGGNVSGTVTLATSQPNYAPAKAGDAMALTSGERGTLTTSVLTTQMTESYRATGAAPTLAQAQFEVIAHMGNASNAGTTKTLKKLDKSTTAKTYTYDDATTPTSVVEAS